MGKTLLGVTCATKRKQKQTLSSPQLVSEALKICAQIAVIEASVGYTL